MSTPHEPTLGELARVLARFEAETSRRLDELGARLDHMVTKDLYEAHRAATSDRIAAVAADLNELREDLDTERSERRADRRVIVSAALGAALALLVAVASAVLLAAVGLK